MLTCSVIRDLLIQHDCYIFCRFDAHCQQMIPSLVPSESFVNSDFGRTILLSNAYYYDEMEEKRVHRKLNFLKEESVANVTCVIQLMKYYRFSILECIEHEKIWGVAAKNIAIQLRQIMNQIMSCHTPSELESLILSVKDYWSTGAIKEKTVVDWVNTKLMDLSIHDVPLFHEFLKNRTIALASVTGNVLYFESIDNTLKSDRDIVVTAVKNDGFAIRYVTDPQLRDDKEIVLLALQSLPFWNKVDGVESVLECVSTRLRNDRQIIRTALQNNWKTVIYASLELRCDRDIMLDAITQNGAAFEYCPSTLATDKQFVLEALNRQYKCGSESHQHERGVFSFLCDTLRNDKDIALAAIQKDPRSYSRGILAHVGLDLRSDKQVVYAAIEKSPTSLQYVSPLLQLDRELVMKAIEKDPYSIKYASAQLLGNKEFMLPLIRRNYKFLQFASPELKADKQIILTAIFSEPTAVDVPKEFPCIALASEQLRRDKDIILEALRRSSKAIEYVPDDLQNDEDVQTVFQLTKDEEQSFTSTKVDSCIIC
jgi:hypothetical protein